MRMCLFSMKYVMCLIKYYTNAECVCGCIVQIWNDGNWFHTNSECITDQNLYQIFDLRFQPLKNKLFLPILPNTSFENNLNSFWISQLRKFIELFLFSKWLFKLNDMDIKSILQRKYPDLAPIFFGILLRWPLNT